jgi:hypothetical protein
MFNPALVTWLVVGGVLTYVVAVDDNVYPWLVLNSKIVGIWFKQQWFKLRYNPDSPWMRWSIDRNADRIAKQFIKERDETND